MLLGKLQTYRASQSWTPSKNITLSNIGSCRKQLGFKIHGFEALPVATDRLAVLEDGTVYHDHIRKLMIEAGIDLQDVEKKVEYDFLPNFKLKGRIDGIVVINNEKFLLEIKTASENSFWKMIRGDISYEYMAQVQASLEALNLTTCIVYLKNKGSGTEGETVVYKDTDFIANLKKRIQEVLNSTPTNLPQRDYEPNEEGQYPYACVGCAWRLHCTGKVDLTPIKAKKSK